MKKLVSLFIVLFFCLHAFAQVPDPCTGTGAAQAISTSSPCNCSETNIAGGTPCNKSVFINKAAADAAINTHLTTQLNYALPNTPVPWQDVRAQALLLSGAAKHEFCTEVTTGSTTFFLFIINIAQVQINCTAVCQDYKFIQKTVACGTNAVTPVLIPSALNPSVSYRRYTVLPNTTYVICRQLYFDGNDLDCYSSWVGSDGVNSLGAQITSQHWFYFESATIVLPLDLINFTATNYNNQNYLSWIPETETNLNRYEIEKSEDGNNFNKIGEVAANTNAAKRYNYTDDNKVTSVKVFYRLKLIQQDGKFLYSKIISITEKTDKIVFSIAPNPAISSTELTIFSDRNTDGKIEILNSGGNIIITKNISLQKGSNYIPIDMSAFSKGIYLVRINNSINISTQKLIIQ